MIQWLRTNWKLIGISLSVLAACLLGFIIPDKSQMLRWFRGSGYYFISGTFFLWILTIVPTKIDRKRIKNFIQQHGIAFSIAALLTIFAFQASPPNFRVLADETNLVGMSMSMYDHKSFYNPIQGQYYYDGFHTISYGWDKRPLFYPFLISIVHTLTGYSGYNGFIVNAVVGFLTIFCFYLLLQRWFSRTYALSGMILLAAFPILIIWVTSSGFEVVNLLFVVLAFLFLDIFLEQKKIRHAECAGLTIVLLGQCRYESILFTLAILPVILFFMHKESLFKNITYRSLLLPFLYLPIVWQRLTQHSHQISSDEVAFSINHFINHVLPAWRFFSGDMEQYGAIPLIFFLAIAGLLGAIIYLIRHRLTPEVTGLVVAGFLSFILEFAVILSYYWGDLTKQYITRMGIVFLPFIVFLAIFFLSKTIKLGYRWKRYLLAGCLGILLLYWPVAGKNEAVKQLTLQRAYTQSLRFLESRYPDRNILIVSDRSGMYTVHRWGAVNFNYANQKALSLLNQLRRHLFQEIIVIQQIAYKNRAPTADTKIDPRYRLKVLYETQIEANLYLRISRVWTPQIGR